MQPKDVIELVKGLKETGMKDDAIKSIVKDYIDAEGKARGYAPRPAEVEPAEVEPAEPMSRAEKIGRKEFFGNAETPKGKSSLTAYERGRLAAGKPLDHKGKAKVGKVLDYQEVKNHFKECYPDKSRRKALGLLVLKLKDEGKTASLKDVKTAGNLVYKEVPARYRKKSKFYGYDTEEAVMRMSTNKHDLKEFGKTTDFIK